MKKCCFVIPYFGKFNNYFPLFLKTCGWNKDFNWLVVTDDNTKYDYPENFRVIKMSFQELRDLVQEKFDFPITLEKPYKLCDYKPAYGYIFEEYLSEFRFWGHCDTDVLMGNLSGFFTDDIFEKYDKIGCLGHMVLYRNTKENNRVFMHEYKGVFLYKKAYTTNEIATFDEEYLYDNNINRIFLAEKRPVLIKDYSFNFHLDYYRFVKVEYIGIYTEKSPHGYRTENYKDAVYLWEDGHIKRYIRGEQCIIEEEMAYIHLQKRKMQFSESLLSLNRIKIIPNAFLELEVPNVSLETFSKIEKWDNLMEFVKSEGRRIAKRLKK